MKGCELCRNTARMYCESDGASLCWDCDAKVHSANFLVAKHSRCLLCHVCQSVTPWIASGTNLGRTISVCVTCGNQRRQDIETSNNDDQDQGIGEDEQVRDSEGEYTSDTTYDDDEDEDEDEDGENQVVPWSCSPSPPPAAISFSSEDLSLSRLSSGGVSSLKRKRLDTDLSSENDTGCSSSTCHGKDETPEIMSSPASQVYDEASTSLRSPRPLLFRPEQLCELVQEVSANYRRL